MPIRILFPLALFLLAMLLGAGAADEPSGQPSSGPDDEQNEPIVEAADQARKHISRSP